MTVAGPLDGVRVIEFSTAWAGPFAGRSLAFLGADVIKIEAPGRPDHWRGTATGGAPLYYPDGEPGADAQNRNVLFNSQNMGKSSVAIDLKAPGALEVVHDLIRRADVLIANFAPGVLDRLGVGWEIASKVNPRLIHVEMPAFGPGGPMSRHWGMGKTMEPAAGMTALMGYDEESPVLTGPAYLDPTGGLNATAAVVTALELRQRTGKGVRIEVPQVEAGSHWIGEFVLEQVETGHTWTPNGNRAPGFAPHNAYPCVGEDAWVVIAVADDDAWNALCEEMERSDLAALFPSIESRDQHADEIDAYISRWTAMFDRAELAHRLQRAGVPAAPVLDPIEVAKDPALSDAGMVVTLDHPAVGRHNYSSVAYRLSRTPGAYDRPAPLFGQHNDAVLGELLGYDAPRISQLRDAGVIADHPTGDYDLADAKRVT